jgi:hypothetical protein
MYINVPRHTSEDEDFGRSAIGKKREYGNLLGVTKKLIHTGVECGHTRHVFATLESQISRLTILDHVNGEGRSHRTSLITMNPHDAKPRVRSLGARNIDGQTGKVACCRLRSRRHVHPLLARPLPLCHPNHFLEVLAPYCEMSQLPLPTEITLWVSCQAQAPKDMLWLWRRGVSAE